MYKSFNTCLSERNDVRNPLARRFHKDRQAFRLYDRIFGTEISTSNHSAFDISRVNPED